VSGERIHACPECSSKTPFRCGGPHGPRRRYDFIDTVEYVPLPSGSVVLTAEQVATSDLDKWACPLCDLLFVADALVDEQWAVDVRDHAISCGGAWLSAAEVEQVRAWIEDCDKGRDATGAEYVEFWRGRKGAFQDVLALLDKEANDA
jgi:hypothetical protein